MFEVADPLVLTVTHSLDLKKIKKSKVLGIRLEYTLVSLWWVILHLDKE